MQKRSFLPPGGMTYLTAKMVAETTANRDRVIIVLWFNGRKEEIKPNPKKKIKQA